MLQKKEETLVSRIETISQSFIDDDPRIELSVSGLKIDGIIKNLDISYLFTPTIDELEFETIGNVEIKPPTNEIARISAHTAFPTTSNIQSENNIAGKVTMRFLDKITIEKMISDIKEITEIINNQR